MAKNNSASAEFDPLADLAEVKSNFLKWGEVGDWIRGTLVDIREVDNRMPGKEGEKQKIYEILAQAGSFHSIDENKRVVGTPTVINAGEYWQIGGKPGLDAQFRNVKLGSIIGLRFAEEVAAKTKGFNPNKIIKLRVGPIDPNYTGQSSQFSESEIDPKDL